MYTMAVPAPTAALRAPAPTEDLPRVSHAYMIGTGGDSGIEYWARRKDQGYRFFISLESGTFCVTSVGPEPPSIADIICRIRDAFKFSISDLAASVQVSRQAVYKWLSGQSASLAPEHQNRLDDLNNAAEVFVLHGIPGSTALLKRRGKGGRTLIEAVQAGESAQEWTRSMIDTLAVERKQTAMLDERLRARKKARPVIDEWGTPMLNEKNT